MQTAASPATRPYHAITQLGGLAKRWAEKILLLNVHLLQATLQNHSPGGSEPVLSEMAIFHQRLGTTGNRIEYATLGDLLLVGRCRIGLQDGKSDGVNWRKGRMRTSCKLIGNDPELRLH